MTNRPSKLPAFILNGWKTLLIGAVGGSLTTAWVMPHDSRTAAPSDNRAIPQVTQVIPNLPDVPEPRFEIHNASEPHAPLPAKYGTSLAVIQSIEQLHRKLELLPPEQLDRELADLHAYAKGNLILEIHLTTVESDRQSFQDSSSRIHSSPKMRETTLQLVSQSKELQEWARTRKLSAELKLAHMENDVGHHVVALKLTESVLNECEAELNSVSDPLSPTTDRFLPSFYHEAIHLWMALTKGTEGPSRYFAPGVLGAFDPIPPKNLHRVIPQPESMGRMYRNCISLLGALLADENVTADEKATLQKAHQFVVQWVAKDEAESQKNFLSMTRRAPHPRAIKDRTKDIDLEELKKK